MSNEDIILSKLGLRKEMSLQPGGGILNETLFKTYRTAAYEDSIRKEVDEVYGMSEIEALHKPSGLRITFIYSEDYNGGNDVYKYYNHFFIDSNMRKVIPLDIDLDKGYFKTSEGEIPFTAVNKQTI